ncbi:MAG: thermonuclease family protein [Chitinophagales bacterium]|nr:thermonuclease family protein [Hyphomicrobiales bacterium]
MHAFRYALYLTVAWIVVDGDTMKAPYGVTYRVLGYDTPETHFAKCDAERRLGNVATRRFEQLLKSGEVKVEETGRIDKYGRTLATVYVNGRDVSEIMIGEGLARAYDGGKRESWCATS